MYNINDIAKYVIKRCNDLEFEISNLQLQKILYYIQGYFLAAFHSVAFSDEIYAWKLGPVIPSVYYDYSYFAANPIKLNQLGEKEEVLSLPLRENEIKLIDSIIKAKINIPVWELVNDTHNESPWLETAQGNVISTDKIQLYFDKVVEDFSKGH
jgi:uncharacterized phage-associated protein